MAWHNSLVVGCAVVGIDVTEVHINSQYYDGYVSLAVQKSFTRTCMVSTVVGEHDGCHAKIEAISVGKYVFHGCHAQKQRKFLCVVLSVTWPYVYGDMDWNCFVLGNLWSIDVILSSVGSFYILFPQKLDPIYTGKWITETWIMAVPHTLLYSAVYRSPGDVILCCMVSVSCAVFRRTVSGFS
jgi:hypothetical protein